MNEHLSEPTADVAEALQDMVLHTTDAGEFLNQLAVFTAETFSAPGQELFCGITLIRPRKAETVASSNEEAQRLDEVQYRFGDGPCLTAAREHTLVHIPDTLHSAQRWPDYLSAIEHLGVRSILGVPLLLDGQADAGVNLYSRQPNSFRAATISAVQAYATQASKAVRLAVRMAALSDAKEDLEAAMSSRTVIDLAVGIIMAQSRCGQEAAVGILKRASSSRNMKLRDVAAAVVASTSQDSVQTHFES
jgi:GAF domain-containing protein